MTELKVHTYTAAEPGIFVNSYLLETADAVVLVAAGVRRAGAGRAGRGVAQATGGGIGAAESHADSYLLVEARESS